MTYFQYRGDTTCSNESMKVAKVYFEDAQWSVGEAYGDGFKLDRTFGKGTITVYDSALKNIWDRDSGCGPYTLGADYDSSNQTCWGFWQPKPGEKYYDIVNKVGEGFTVGLPASGNQKTEATRPTRLHTVIYYRKGGPAAGFIEGTIAGGKVRAEKRVAAREAPMGHLQLGATTKDVTPWETWILNVPNVLGSHSCEDKGKDVYINYGFNMGSTPVLWDTKVKGGGACTITVTKTAAAVGDTIEGTFVGTLGDGNAASPGSHPVESGSFKVPRAM